MALFDAEKGRQHESASAGCQPPIEGLVDSLLNQLLAPRCPFCDGHSPQQHAPCPECRTRLPWIKAQCPRCALPLARPELCGQCLRQPPPQQQAWAALSYAQPLRGSLHRLKFRGALELAPALSALLLEGLQRQPPPLQGIDAVIPAPLHPARLRQRGFNQALELCRPLARQYQLALEPQLLQRARPTAEQTRLHADQRRRNVRNAFACPSRLNGEHLLIFDDVITTGATAQAMARALLKAGAGRISVIALARTP